MLRRKVKVQRSGKRISQAKARRRKQWAWNILPKDWWVSTRSHDIAFRKILLFIVTSSQSEIQLGYLYSEESGWAFVLRPFSRFWQRVCILQFLGVEIFHWLCCFKHHKIWRKMWLLETSVQLSEGFLIYFSRIKWKSVRK
jgi:hypothetical protein